MEKERGIFKQPQNTSEEENFVAQYGTSSESVLLVRMAALNATSSIRDYLSAGIVKKERLKEISEDDKLQTKFLKIMDHIEADKITGSFRSLDEIFALPLDQQAGWLLYFIDYNEKFWNIKLLNEEERAL